MDSLSPMSAVSGKRLAVREFQVAAAGAWGRYASSRWPNCRGLNSRRPCPSPDTRKYRPRPTIRFPVSGRVERPRSTAADQGWSALPWLTAPGLFIGKIRHELRLLRYGQGGVLARYFPHPHETPRTAPAGRRFRFLRRRSGAHDLQRRLRRGARDLADRPQVRRQSGLVRRRHGAGRSGLRHPARRRRQGRVPDPRAVLPQRPRLPGDAPFAFRGQDPRVQPPRDQQAGPHHRWKGRAQRFRSRR